MTVVNDNQTVVILDDSSGRLDQDFGYQNGVPAGNIGDFIYNDINGNGIQNVGELGIAGIDVELCLLDEPLILGAVLASDDYSAQAYSNNAVQWASDWIEVDDDGSPFTATGAAANDGFFIGLSDGSIKIKSVDNEKFVSLFNGQVK